MRAIKQHDSGPRLEVETEHRAGRAVNGPLRPTIPGLPGDDGVPPGSPGPTFPVPPIRPGDWL